MISALHVLAACCCHTDTRTYLRHSGDENSMALINRLKWQAGSFDFCGKLYCSNCDVSRLKYVMPLKSSRARSRMVTKRSSTCSQTAHRATTPGHCMYK